MATNQTSNYNLNQWEPEDQVLRQEFNDDNDKIDKALKALADQDKTLEQTLAEQAAAIAKCGTCKFECLSYNGTGAQTTTISFTHKPVFFIIQGNQGMLFSTVQSGKALSLLQGSSTYFENPVLTWSGSQATLSGVTDAYQMNESGQRYWVFALYHET